MASFCLIFSIFLFWKGMEVKNEKKEEDYIVFLKGVGKRGRESAGSFSLVGMCFFASLILLIIR